MKTLLTSLLLCSTSAIGWAGTTYYVAPGGSDKNPGTPARPFATLQKAADTVQPGDTVIVRDGTYTGPAGQWANIVHLKAGGAADRPIVFKAEHKWDAVLDGRGNATGFGVAFDAGGRGRDYVTIQDFEIRDTCYHGIPPQGQIAGHRQRHRRPCPRSRLRRQVPPARKGRRYRRVPALSVFNSDASVLRVAQSAIHN